MSAVSAQDEPAPDAANDLIQFVDKPLPKLSQLELPTVEELLQKRPVDWIVVRDEEVLIVEPLDIRPDAVGTLQKLLEESKKWERPRTDAERELQQLKRLRLQYLDVVLAEGGDDEIYQLNVDKWVEQIIYHEDLMLRRIDKLLDEGNLRQAFELLWALERRHPGWPGADQRQYRMQFAEAQVQLDGGKLEIGFGTLEQLHARRRGYPGLYEALGKTADQIITSAVEADDYRRARFFIARLGRLEPEHPTVASWTEELTGRARQLIEKASQLSRESSHAAAAHASQKAAEVWPKAPGLRETHRRTNSRFQILQVGVVQQPTIEPLEYLETAADYRHRRLTELRLFDIDRFNEAAHHDSRVFEEWEPTDLARQMDFRLRPTRAYWESQQVVTAPPIVRTLTSRLDAESPQYDERLASYISGLATRSPFEFRVSFARVPVRAESLFNLSIQPGDSEDGGQLSPLSQRFVVEERDDSRIVYLRSVPEPDTARQFHVASVVERKYESDDQAIQALLRGEVSMLPRLRSRDVASLRGDDRFFVIKGAIPTTHVLQFNPESLPMQNQQLRRAMAYSINRPKILREAILNTDSADLGRVVSAPFPSKSYAYNALVQPRDYNFPLAMALSVAARKQLEQTAPLRMLCLPDAEMVAAAKRLVEDWATVGIEVEVVEIAPSELKGPGVDALPEWDLLYRTVKMTEPIYDLWPFLTMQDRAEVTSLAHFPGWLRQQIIELDAVTDMDSAVKLLHSLHINLQSQVTVIPLWELEDFQVLRKNISNFPQAPTHPYQGVERWIVTPWYSTEEL